MKPLGVEDDVSSILASDPLNTQTVNVFNFDQVFVFGIPPNKTEDDKPELLIAYPSFLISDINPYVVLDHSLPLGTKKRKTKGGTNIIQEEFVFLLKKGNDTLYCTTIIFLPHPKSLPFFVSKNTQKNLFAICMVSRIPSIAYHLRFLTSLVLAISDQIPKMNNIKCKPEYVFQEEIVRIESLTAQTRNVGHLPLFSVPDYFCDLIFLYQVCTPGSPPIDLSPKVKLLFPMNTDPKQILWTGLDTVCSVLDPKSLLDVLSGLMLDYQILIIGTSMEEVSMTVLTLVQLIDPMKYSGMVIPLLPQVNSDYIDLLGAPVPYIVGVTPTDDLLKAEFMDSTLFVNIDSLKMEIEKELPVYPNKEVLVKMIKQVLDKASKEYTYFSIPEDYLSTLKHKYVFSNVVCENILRNIRQPFDMVLSDFIYSFFMTDLDKGESSTVFNKQLFIDCMPANPFFKELVNSQTFELWTSKKLEEFLILKGEDIPKPSKPKRRDSKRIRRKSINTKILGIH